ncbi:hypothetical protein C8A01DRAFT_18575, partial [Parachaetomium inaequale]
ILSPSTPAEPLNDCERERPTQDSHFPPTRKTGVKWSKEKLRSGSYGLWTKFLSFFTGLGIDVAIPSKTQVIVELVSEANMIMPGRCRAQLHIHCNCQPVEWAKHPPVPPGPRQRYCPTPLAQPLDILPLDILRSGKIQTSQHLLKGTPRNLPKWSGPLFSSPTSCTSTSTSHRDTSPTST